MVFENIRTLREDHDLSQKKIADYYHTSIDYLVGRSSSPKYEDTK